jgi:2-dehydropantoate 2-reductase
MKVVILGAGAMGCLVGAHLKKGGAEVWFVDPYEAHMQAIRERGLDLTIEQTGVREFVPIDGATTDSSEVGSCDVIIILVKGTTTDAILEANKGLIGDDTVIMTFQNGIGNVDIIRKYVPEERIGYGVLKSGASLLAPGVVQGTVRKAGEAMQNLYMSPVAETTRGEVFQEIMDCLNRAEFTTVKADNVEALIWDKMYINCLVNIPGAVLHLSIEECIRNEHSAYVMQQAGRELCAVATAKGYPMDAEKLWAATMAPLAKRPVDVRHYASAAQDARKKRKTEVDFLNGAVVREGKKLGIATPFNEVIWHFGKAAEDNYENQF